MRRREQASMKNIGRKDRTYLLVALAMAVVGLRSLSFSITEDADVALRSRRSLANEHDKKLTDNGGSSTDDNGSSVLLPYDPKSNPWIKEPPTWILDYANFHAKALREARSNPNDDPNLYLVYECRENCGGASERQRGIQSLFLQAVLTKRVFLIDHPNPVPLDQILWQNLIEWNATLPILNDESKMTKIDGMGRKNEFYYKDVLKTNDMPVIRIQTNMPMHPGHIWRTESAFNFFSEFYDMTDRSKFWQAPPPELKKWIYQALFRPSDALIETNNQVRADLGLKENLYYVSMHVRIGNTGKWDDDISIHRYEDLPKFLLCAKGQQAFLRETRALNYDPPIVVVSDDALAKEKLKELDSSILYADVPIVHVDKSDGPHNNLEANLHVYSDLMILARGFCVTTSMSGFSSLAVSLSQTEEESKFYSYFNSCPDKYLLAGKRAEMAES